MNWDAQFKMLVAAAIAAEIIALLFFCWLMYIVTKLAIRDGIKESGLVRAIDLQNRGTDTKPMHLPEMTAD